MLTGLSEICSVSGLSHTVMGISQGCEITWQSSSKVDFIIEQWTNTCRPVFWIDPHARLKGHPLLPQALGCDFAVHREVERGDDDRRVILPPDEICPRLARYLATAH